MSYPNQGQRDRAIEWTSEHYPDATGAEWDERYDAALADIVEIDATSDATKRELS